MQVAAPVFPLAFNQLALDSSEATPSVDNIGPPLTAVAAQETPSSSDDDLLPDPVRPAHWEDLEDPLEETTYCPSIVATVRIAK